MPDSSAKARKVVQRSSPVLKGDRPKRATARYPTTAIVGLQRAAGNSAVNALLRREQHAEPTSTESLNPVIDNGGVRGRSVASGVRRPIEARFGADLSAVRVHVGSETNDRAAQLGAVAFTRGRHIYVQQHLVPDSALGRRVLAHELTHVVQQARGAAGAPLATARALEGEARAVAGGIAPTASPTVGGAAFGTVQKVKWDELDKAAPTADEAGKGDVATPAAVKDQKDDAGNVYATAPKAAKHTSQQQAKKAKKAKEKAKKVKQNAKEAKQKAKEKANKVTQKAKQKTKQRAKRAAAGKGRMRFIRALVYYHSRNGVAADNWKKSQRGKRIATRDAHKAQLEKVLREQPKEVLTELADKMKRRLVDEPEARARIRKARVERVSPSAEDLEIVKAARTGPNPTYDRDVNRKPTLRGKDIAHVVGEAITRTRFHSKSLPGGANDIRNMALNDAFVNQRVIGFREDQIARGMEQEEARALAANVPFDPVAARAKVKQQYWHDAGKRPSRPGMDRLANEEAKIAAKLQAIASEDPVSAVKVAPANVHSTTPREIPPIVLGSDEVIAAAPKGTRTAPKATIHRTAARKMSPSRTQGAARTRAASPAAQVLGMLRDAQVAIIQGAESRKIAAAEEEHRDTIERLRQQGRYVAVYAVMDAPATKNVLDFAYVENADIEHFVRITLQDGASAEEALNPPARIMAATDIERDQRFRVDPRRDEEAPAGRKWRRELVGDVLEPYSRQSDEGGSLFPDLSPAQRYEHLSGVFKTEGSSRRMQVQFDGEDVNVNAWDALTGASYAHRVDSWDHVTRILQGTFVSEDSAESIASTILVQPDGSLVESYSVMGPGAPVRKTAVWTRDR